jgi:hypothetical protein
MSKMLQARLRVIAYATLIFVGFQNCARVEFTSSDNLVSQGSGRQFSISKNPNLPVVDSGTWITYTVEEETDAPIGVQAKSAIGTDLYNFEWTLHGPNQTQAMGGDDHANMQFTEAGANQTVQVLVTDRATGETFLLSDKVSINAIGNCILSNLGIGGNTNVLINVATTFMGVRNGCTADEVAFRNWRSGDGTQLDGPVDSFIHPYQRPGRYLVSTEAHRITPAERADLSLPMTVSSPTCLGMNSLFVGGVSSVILHTDSNLNRRTFKLMLNGCDSFYNLNSISWEVDQAVPGVPNISSQSYAVTFSDLSASNPDTINLTVRIHDKNGIEHLVRHRILVFTEETFNCEIKIPDLFIAGPTVLNVNTLGNFSVKLPSCVGAPATIRWKKSDISPEEPVENFDASFYSQRIYNYDAEGSYLISAQVTAAGRTFTLTKYVNVLANPACVVHPPLSSAPTNLCNPGIPSAGTTNANSYSWNCSQAGSTTQCSATRVAYSCNVPAGTNIANSTLCSNDDQQLTQNTNVTLINACSTPKCQRTCNANYGLNITNTACVSCVGNNQYLDPSNGRCITCAPGQHLQGNTCVDTVSAVCASNAASSTAPTNTCSAGSVQVPPGVTANGPTWNWNCEGIPSNITNNRTCTSPRVCPTNQVISGNTCACASGTLDIDPGAALNCQPIAACGSSVNNCSPGTLEDIPDTASQLWNCRGPLAGATNDDALNCSAVFVGPQTCPVTQHREGSGTTADPFRCVDNICGGSPLSNASLCAGDNLNVLITDTFRLVNSCTSTKCEMTCNAGFMSNSAGTACISYPGTWQLGQAPLCPNPLPCEYPLTVLEGTVTCVGGACDPNARPTPNTRTCGPNPTSCNPQGSCQTVDQSCHANNILYNSIQCQSGGIPATNCSPACVDEPVSPQTACNCPGSQTNINGVCGCANGGTGVNCILTASACGAASNPTGYRGQPPLNLLCNNGLPPTSGPTFIGGVSNSFSWSCGSANCSTPYIADATCGPSHGGSVSASTPLNNGLCSATGPGGEALAPFTIAPSPGSSQYFWSCNGINGGLSSDQCTAYTYDQGTCATHASPYSAGTVMGGSQLCQNGDPIPGSITVPSSGSVVYQCRKAHPQAIVPTGLIASCSITASPDSGGLCEGPGQISTRRCNGMHTDHYEIDSDCCNGASICSGGEYAICW